MLMSDSLEDAVQVDGRPAEIRNIVIVMTIATFDRDISALVGTATTFMFDNEGVVELELRTLFDDAYEFMMTFMSRRPLNAKEIKFRVLNEEHTLDKRYEFTIVRMQDIDEQKQMATLAMKLKELSLESE